MFRLPSSFTRQARRLSKRVFKRVSVANQGFEKHVLQRLPRFRRSWRFLTSWLLLLGLIIGCLIAQFTALGGYYQSRQPVAGGIYTEGILGSFTNANPVYATNEVDRTVSKLLFPGLFTHDNENNLVGDLAQSWSLDKTGTVYTVTLKQNLRWQDGEPLTAGDVVFTYQVIQNADAQSPLEGSWKGIEVSASDARTVVFRLPTPLASFLDGVTNGIIPKHKLARVPMVGMRSAAFNTQSPVGAGPFEWRNITVHGSDPSHAEELIGLTASSSYYRGEPKLKSFVVHAFADQDAMISAYRNRQLTAMSGLRVLPKALDASSFIVRNFSTTAATMVFFKNNDSLLKDVKLRQALVQSADRGALIDKLGYRARPVDEPLLRGQLGYDRKYAQQTNNPRQAAKLLDAAGWKLKTDGFRAKKSQELSINLTYADSPEYEKVASTLQTQWKAAGIRMNKQPLDEQSFKQALANHAYQAVLYGITIGTDPDVFVYWNSSQADTLSGSHLNLSEYKSKMADEALDAGRTRNSDNLRVIKYAPFLKQWQKDAPALGLYQPRYLYLTRVHVYNLDRHVVNSPTDRLNNVQDWMIRTARVTNN